MENPIKTITLWMAFAALFWMASTGAQAGWPEAKAAYQKKDFDRAIQELQTLVNQDMPEAQFLVGWMFENGEGVPQDNREAMAWYHKAAARGYAPAQNNLGWLYEKGTGIGVPINNKEAAAWYRKAAERGYAPAQFNLGLIYYIGHKNDLPRDYKMAATWYTKAADQGLVNAQNALANMYENGVGMPVSLVQAYKWYSLSASAGNEIGRAGKESLEKRLDPDLLEEARGLVREWRASRK